MECRHESICKLIENREWENKKYEYKKRYDEENAVYLIEVG